MYLNSGYKPPEGDHTYLNRSNSSIEGSTVDWRYYKPAVLTPVKNQVLQ
jgi:hypothetical protein